MDIAPEKPLIRLVTCGSVDDGKSTLTGRLLYELGAVFDDHLAQMQKEGQVDFAALSDGLSAEAEQGITIDVAHRYCETPAAKFIITDAPGHEEYTRNMVTAAADADIALILIDITRGISPQTLRHIHICHLLGLRRIVFVINKMDLVEYSRIEFNDISVEIDRLIDRLGLPDGCVIPISAVFGENLTQHSARMPWYDGHPLLQALLAPLPQKRVFDGFLMPVQYVARAPNDRRHYMGQAISGRIRARDPVVILPSGQVSRVAQLAGPDGPIENGQSGQALSVQLSDDVDCARGHVIASADTRPQMADQFEADIIWMQRSGLIPGRAYAMKIGAQWVNVRLAAPKYLVNVQTGDQLAAKSLGMNEIGRVVITIDRIIPFVPFDLSHYLGGFLLVDKVSNETAGAGMIRFALRRAQNIHWQGTDVTAADRARQLGQAPKVIWLTGLSGSGKSTIANALDRALLAQGRHSYLLDGDNIRHGLNKDLGFTQADRIENIRRVGEVARLMADAGLIVIAAFISPFAAERSMVRDMLPKGDFCEVHIDAPLQLCEARDVKGLYAKARRGEIKNFTGIDSPYEPPQNPDVYINTDQTPVDQAVALILEYLAH